MVARESGSPGPLDTTVKPLYCSGMVETGKDNTGRRLFRPATRRERSGAALTAGLIALFFACAAVIAAGWVDFGRMVGPCGFQQRFGLPCVTCWMTRSVIAFVQGRIWDAFYMQPAAALFCCVAVLAEFLALPIVIRGVYWCFLDRLFREIRVWHWIVAVVVVLAGGWAVTLARAIAAKQP